MFQRQGHFDYDEFSHRLLKCPRSMSIINHIQINLTKQKYITPVHIVLTNNRCIHQIKAYSDGNKSPVKEHNPCSFLILASLKTWQLLLYGIIRSNI